MKAPFERPAGKRPTPTSFAAFRGRTVYLERVPLDANGNDPGGVYWGDGAPLWCAWTRPGFVGTPPGHVVFFRAADRAAARAAFPFTLFFMQRRDGGGATISHA